MTTSLPTSAWLAWWATAWLRGHVVTDEVLDALAADGRLHVTSDGGSIASALARVRTGGADGCGVALPVAGDPLGLGGPRELNDLALEAGEALVCPGAGVALVPEATDEVVTWHAAPASPRQLPDLGEADRELRRTTPKVADTLAALDVARWRPEVADLFFDRRRAPLAAPAGTPARCVDLATRALTARAITELALSDDGGATSASEMAVRREALLPLDRAARRGLVAACSSEAWPPG